MTTLDFPDDHMTIDVVYSPDDGGYWLHGYWYDPNTGKVTDAESANLWATQGEAIESALAGHVKWQ